MSFSDVASIGWNNFFGLLGSVFWALVLWSFIGIAVVVAIYKGVKRAGWLTTIAGKRRWPGALLALVLLLGVWPPLVGVGVVGALRDTTLSVLRSQVAEQEHFEALGTTLVLPMVAARAVADGADPTALEVSELESGDVSFLLDAGERRKASEALSAAVLDLAPWQFDHRSWDSRWLRDYSRAKMASFIEGQRAPYEALFANLKADRDGGLSFGSARKQVSNAFLGRHVYPQVSKVFNGVRLNLLLTAALIVIAVLLSLWWMARRVASRTSKIAVDDRAPDR